VTAAAALRRRLSSYWRMEIAGAVLVPAIALWFGFPQDAIAAATLGVAILAVSLLLVIGGLYWRGR